MNAYEKWQVVVGVFQTSVLVGTLVAAIYIGLKQVEIAQQQTDISAKQAEISAQQVRNQSEAEGVQYRADLAKLRIATLKILDSFPMTGVSTVGEWSLSERSRWLAELRTLLDEQSTNLALIKNKELFDNWLDASAELRIVEPLNRTVDSTGAFAGKDVLVKILERVFKRVMGVAIAEGFLRSTTPPVFPIQQKSE